MQALVLCSDRACEGCHIFLHVGSCNAATHCLLPCRARYINTVKYLVDLGFYVNIDFHSIDPDVSIHNFEVGAAACPDQKVTL